MHISRGVFFVYVALHSIIYNSEPETRLERNPSKIIYIPVAPAQNNIRHDLFDRFSWFLFVYTFTSLVTSIDTLHPRTPTIGSDETGKS